MRYQKPILHFVSIAALLGTIVSCLLGVWSFWRVFELRVTGWDSSYAVSFYSGRMYVSRLNEFKLAESWNYGSSPLPLPPGPSDAPQGGVLGIRWSDRAPTFPSIITLSFVGIPFVYVFAVSGLIGILSYRRARRISSKHGFPAQFFKGIGGP